MSCIRAVSVWVCLAFSALLFGQVGTEGAFFGTVADGSGSSVPGAHVKATHLATGLSKEAVSDVQGNFSILSLPIGQYSVVVTADGFKQWELPDAQITVGDRTRLSPVLTVGAIIRVGKRHRRTRSSCKRRRASAETVVQMQQIRSLPLDTRNPLALVATAPGMQ